MKRNSIIIAAVLLLTSCATNYVATDSVTRDLDGTRRILTSSSDTAAFIGWQEETLTTPQVFDFRSEKDTMRYSYSLAVQRDGWTIIHDSLPRMLQPEVTVGKSFRWFTTRYRYTARFPQLDSLPVPIDDYLTPDEQQLLFTPNELPDDWTGTDLYGMLDKLNSKYVKWWNHCLFEKEMEAYASHCDSTQKALLAQYHDTLLTIIQAKLPDERKSLDQVCRQFPELSFVGNITWDGNGTSDNAFIWAFEHWGLNTHVIWRTELPGGHTVEHMVSADRMIMGDYVIDEHSDTFNWWAVALSLLILAGGAVLLMRRK